MCARVCGGVTLCGWACVCASVCVCVMGCVHVRSGPGLCACVFVCTCMCVCVWGCVRARVSLCVFVRVCAWVVMWVRDWPAAQGMHCLLSELTPRCVRWPVSACPGVSLPKSLELENLPVGRAFGQNPFCWGPPARVGGTGSSFGECLRAGDPTDGPAVGRLCPQVS